MGGTVVPPKRMYDHNDTTKAPPCRAGKSRPGALLRTLVTRHLQRLR